MHFLLHFFCKFTKQITNHFFHKQSFCCAIAITMNTLSNLFGFENSQKQSKKPSTNHLQESLDDIASSSNDNEKVPKFYNNLQDIMNIEKEARKHGGSSMLQTSRNTITITDTKITATTIAFTTITANTITAATIIETKGTFLRSLVKGKSRQILRFKHKTIFFRNQNQFG